MGKVKQNKSVEKVGKKISRNQKKINGINLVRRLFEERDDILEKKKSLLEDVETEVIEIMSNVGGIEESKRWINKVYKKISIIENQINKNDTELEIACDSLWFDEEEN